MFINSSMNDNYAIVYDNRIMITGINNNGTPIFSASDYRRFSSPTSANDYIRLSLKNALQLSNDFAFDEFEKYSVHQVRTQTNQMNKAHPFLEVAYECIFNEKDVESIRSVLRQAVIRGFNKLQLGKEKTFEILHSSKYEDIVKSVVPPHMISNLDLFMDRGIMNCGEEELGAIIMTSSDTVLKYINIDTYNISR